MHVAPPSCTWFSVGVWDVFAHGCLHFTWTAVYPAVSHFQRFLIGWPDLELSVCAITRGKSLVAPFLACANLFLHFGKGSFFSVLCIVRAQLSAAPSRNSRLIVAFVTRQAVFGLRHGLGRSDGQTPGSAARTTSSLGLTHGSRSGLKCASPARVGKLVFTVRKICRTMATAHAAGRRFTRSELLQNGGQKKHAEDAG